MLPSPQLDVGKGCRGHLSWQQCWPWQERLITSDGSLSGP